MAREAPDPSTLDMRSEIHARSRVVSPPRCPIPTFRDVESRVFLDVVSARGVDSSWGVKTSEARIYECPVSGLRFREPASKEEIAAFYGQTYHESMVGAGDDAARTRAYRKENVERIKHLGRYLSAGRVLDIGCSTGLFASQMKEAGYDAYGTDISDFACDEAEKALGPGKVFRGSLDDLVSKERGSFDAVTMMDVIEHFEDVVTPLRQILQLLKPGGVLFMRTPTLRSPFYKVADLSYRLSLGRYRDAVLKIYHAEHFYFFTEEAMRALVSDTGYELVAIDADPLLWENFRSAEMRQGPLINAVLGAVYFLGRAVGRGHGMKVVARKPA
jgi:2-polyprenyl-3-methyl-5-hydroxy-6-metoxy-1,4-benzoquinol methylase